MAAVPIVRFSPVFRSPDRPAAPANCLDGLLADLRYSGVVLRVRPYAAVRVDFERKRLIT